MKDFTKQVEDYVTKWADILNLRDWRIHVAIEEKALPGDTDEYEAGCVFHSYEHHEARIHILHPEHWHKINPYWDESKLEHIVVHELLHLHFCHLELLASWKAESQELAINQLSNAFLGLDNETNTT